MRLKATWWMAFAVLAAAVSGCGSLDKLERENYQRECDNLGIARGTPSYDECMLQQQRLEEESTQRSIDRSTERDILKKLDN